MAIPVIVPIVVVAAIAAAASSKPRRSRAALPIPGPDPDEDPSPVPGPAAPLPCWRREPTPEAPFGFVSDADGACIPGPQPVVFAPGGWDLPENWYGYRTPLARGVAFAQGDIIAPPLEVAYVLLLQELIDTMGQQDAEALMPRAPEPPDGGFWQTDVPNTPDYYSGPDEILSLMYHLADFVNGAYARWEGGDEFYLSPEG